MTTDYIVSDWNEPKINMHRSRDIPNEGTILKLPLGGCQGLPHTVTFDYFMLS